MKYEEISNKINECKNKSLDELNIDELDDISNIKIDKRKSSDEILLFCFNFFSNVFSWFIKVFDNHRNKELINNRIIFS